MVLLKLIYSRYQCKPQWKALEADEFTEYDVKQMGILKSLEFYSYKIFDLPRIDGTSITKN
jgi:hypothetical protein